MAWLESIDDPLGVRVAPAAGRAGDLLEGDGVAELVGELAERLDEMGVRVARQRLTRRLERQLLDAGQRIRLREPLSRDSTDWIRSLCVSGEGEAGWRGGSVRS